MRSRRRVASSVSEHQAPTWLNGPFLHLPCRSNVPQEASTARAHSGQLKWARHCSCCGLYCFIWSKHSHLWQFSLFYNCWVERTRTIRHSLPRGLVQLLLAPLAHTLQHKPSCPRICFSTNKCCMPSRSLPVSQNPVWKQTDADPTRGRCEEQLLRPGLTQTSLRSSRLCTQAWQVEQPNVASTERSVHPPEQDSDTARLTPS